MSEIDIIRAWKDEDYLNSLSESMRAQLPENPAGIIELNDEEQQFFAGRGIEISKNGNCQISRIAENCISLKPGDNCRVLSVDRSEITIIEFSFV